VKLVKPETAAPTPLAISLVVGTGLLMLLLWQPQVHAAALLVLRSPDALERLGIGAAIGRGAVQYWPVTLAVLGAAGGVAWYRSRRPST
jgi:hypothetical protein